MGTESQMASLTLEKSKTQRMLCRQYVFYPRLLVEIDSGGLRHWPPRYLGSRLSPSPPPNLLSTEIPPSISSPCHFWVDSIVIVLLFCPGLSSPPSLRSPSPSIWSGLVNLSGINFSITVDLSELWVFLLPKWCQPGSKLFFCDSMDSFESVVRKERYGRMLGFSKFRTIYHAYTNTYGPKVYMEGCWR